jgi:hypothetical protein
MKTVKAKWVAAVGIVVALGTNPRGVLHAQDAKSISDQEAPFCRLYRGVARLKLALFEFASTSVAEARSSLWQEQDFSSKDHCAFAPQCEPFYFRK